MSVGQSNFRAALLDANQPVPIGLRDGGGRAAGRRFDVYRNNVAVSLTEALETGFPVIAKLVGSENFKKVAALYLRAHPPKSPLMMFYGADFPEFLSGFEPLESIGYLADVARLELALRRSYHAEDAAPIAAEALAAVPPQEMATLRLTLAPSVQTLSSPWPVFDIWAYNSRDGATKPKPEAQDVIVLRHGFDPEPHPLPSGGARVVEAIRSGQPLPSAMDAVDDGFDLSHLIGLLLAANAITSLTTGEPDE